MTKRQVKCTTKNTWKEVTHVGGIDNHGIKFYESEANAVYHIENGLHTYFTYVNGYLAEIHVVVINGKKHLRTDRDGSTQNNLAELPNC